MIDLKTISLAQISSDRFYEIPKYLDETIRKISKITHDLLLKPALIGFAGEVCLFTGNLALSQILNLTSIGKVFASKKLSELYIKHVQNQLFTTIFLSPFLEEILFRFMIHHAIYSRLTQILPDINVDIFSYHIKLAELVSIVATSVLFGSLHLTSGLGLSHAILSTVSGITLGLLYHEFGPVTSTTAHVTVNAIALGLIRFGV